MHLKYVLFGGACLLSYLAAVCQDMIKCLVLLKNDETTVLFPLDEKPKITVPTPGWFFYDRILIETNNGQMEFYVPEIDKLEMVEISGVNSPQADGKDNISILDRQLLVEASAQGTAYSISDMNGKIYKSGGLPVGLSAISLSDLQFGIYLITVGGKTIKTNIK